jgi:class 3 adenylate cyclase
VIGDTVNVAARLQVEASPGEVLIGTMTHSAARDRVTVEPVGFLDLTGRAESVEVFHLLDVRD